ncbi:MAG: hypothetical protein CVU11_14520 [Bacteroidetes bacterium HGW-Bacteroidetes-6]|jgi:hypothetical protein|nr:MAG: hypothetical protein CVU11_14520 [Bacteroidetes bacterium HGW-Bacteroidetes-6]
MKRSCIATSCKTSFIAQKTNKRLQDSIACAAAILRAFFNPIFLHWSKSDLKAFEILNTLMGSIFLYSFKTTRKANLFYSFQAF